MCDYLFILTHLPYHFFNHLYFFHLMCAYNQVKVSLSFGTLSIIFTTLSIIFTTISKKQKQKQKKSFSL